MISLQQVQFEESDHALIQRYVAEEDGEAFSLLMARYADMVYTTCRRILGNEEQAADAVEAIARDGADAAMNRFN